MGNKVTMDVIAGVNVDSTGLIVDTSKTGTGVRSSIGVNAGKVYFEVNVTGNINIGLCDETNNLKSTGYHSSSSFVVQYGWNNYTTLYLSSTVYPYHTPVILDLSKKNTIAFALDMEKYLLSIYLNGVLAINSFALTGKLTNLGSKLYPFLFTGGSNNVSHTEWNFGATPFKYPIPEGYNSYEGSSLNKYLLKDDEGYKRLIPATIDTETCVPIMTSATTPSGEVTCSSQYSDTLHAAWTAFARDASNIAQRSWWCQAMKGWIQYEFTSAKTIVKYTIRSHITHPEQFSPEQWTFEGSNDGINYVILDTRVNEINWGIWEKREYSFKNNNKYTHYKLNLTRKSGSIAIEEIEMFEKDSGSVELVSTKSPTEDQFKEKGMSDIPSYSQLSNFNDLVTYTPSLLSKSLVKFKPKAKTILSSGAINFSGKELKKVSLIGTDNVRVLFSKDRGVTWYNKTKSEKVSEIKTAKDNGVTVVCTAEDGINYSGWKAFDGYKLNAVTDYTNRWQTYTNNTNYVDHHWVRYDFGENNAKVVNRVYIQSIANVNVLPGSLKDYSIEGSNDGIVWVELIKDSLPDYPIDTLSNFMSPSIPNTTPYRYVRINLLSNSIVGYNVFNISEIEIYGEPAPIPISGISTQGLTPTQLTAITPEEWKTFMGDSSTLRFAYYLPDETANTDKLELTVDFIGE